MEFSKEQLRLLMLYDFKSGLNARQCHQRLLSAFPDVQVSERTIERWFSEFRDQKESIQDQPRSGRPKTAVTQENIRIVESLIRDFRNITYEEIQDALGISADAVHSILHDHLRVRKLVSRWIPHLLDERQKQGRVDWCKFMIEKFDRGQSASVSDIVTGDETYIYCYDPGTKQQDTVWVFEEDKLPTKVVRGRSTGKQLVAIFFRRKGLVASVPLEQHKTVTADWYCTTCLPMVFSKLEEERPHMGLRGIFLHQDNAPAHTASKTSDFLQERHVKLVGHPPHSPDLAPCDFYLFPKMKKYLREKRYSSAEEAVAAMNDFLESLPKKALSDCFASWFDRMQKCIDANGEYFEKQ